MSDKINHSGVVETVDGEHLRVRILQTSACSACKVAGHCSAAESKEKIVDVVLGKGSVDYKVGDNVVVSTTQSAVGKALFVGFLLPFGVMVVALLVAIASLVPYYLIIYILRDRLGRSVTFSIEKEIINKTY